MAKTKILFRPGAFAELRTSGEVMAALNEIAQGIADRCGEGFEATPAVETGGRVRGRATVVTATPRAMVVQAKRHVIERAL